MRAILINPRDRTVHSIETDGKLEELKKLVVCETIGRASLGADVDMWLDDEGHLQPGKCIFEFAGNDTRFAGNAVILGGDRASGETVSLELGLEKILEIVRWTEMASSGQMGEGFKTATGFHMGLPISAIRPAEPYVIWSNEHRAWWGPGSSGYVQRLAEAGRYARQHALQICKDAQGGWNGSNPPPEVPVRLLDAIAARLEGRVLN